MIRKVAAYLLLAFSANFVIAETIDGAAPDFTLKSNSGENLRLNELKGEVVLLNFWASWCGPCRKEMPELDKLQKKYKRLGFTVLGVNVEPDASAANMLLAKSPVGFPILYDSESTVSKLYDVSAMPTTILIDRSGTMRFKHLAFVPGFEKKYEREIRQLLRE